MVVVPEFRPFENPTFSTVSIFVSLSASTPGWSSPLQSVVKSSANNGSGRMQTYGQVRCNCAFIQPSPKPVGLLLTVNWFNAAARQACRSTRAA